jgi:MFS family permease
MSRIAGHYAPWFIATLIGSLIGLTLLPSVAAHVGWQLLLALLGAVVLLALSMFAHNRHLCERCIASVPLDASGAAARYAIRFRVAHLFERRRYAVGYLTIVVGSSLLDVHPVGRYGWAVVQMSLIYLLVVYVTHQRLQPWCPYCRNGGEELATPTTPTPVSSYQ